MAIIRDQELIAAGVFSQFFLNFSQRWLGRISGWLWNF